MNKLEFSKDNENNFINFMKMAKNCICIIKISIFPRNMLFAVYPISLSYLK